MRLLKLATAVAAALSCAWTAASAQSTVSPSSDWNGNYGFSSTADRNLRLLQSDLIKKAEEGYYESLGRQTYNVTTNNNVTNNSSSTTEIGQQTTTIGAMNNTTNTIDVRDSTNIDISTDSNATSTGCQNGAITIDSPSPIAGGTTCN
ncbi:hypothetical protein [Aureimonas mangrovi]|uniref:hypothetical protein n=1 Tax=Aureimonas mangrovi TaxID=2758041 RepID=UPI00163DBA21|nr:hypothetical protein [Aureimonas mangrovi]